MSNKKALFVGCSFTADCGFTLENQRKYHWPHLFCQSTGFDIVNHASGGMPNDEIFFRTTEAVLTNHYDLVIVMWSEADRRWAYCSKNNIDDFTILNSGRTKGYQSNVNYVKEYADMHYLHFNNRYVNIKHWLLNCWALEKTLKNRNIPFVFIKGFSNDIDTISSVEYNNGFKNIQKLKTMLDFDNRPDDYIQRKLSILQKLVDDQDQTRWLNLNGPSFFEMKSDAADDRLHPGPNTNRMLADNLITFYKEFNE